MRQPVLEGLTVAQKTKIIGLHQKKNLTYEVIAKKAGVPLATTKQAIKNLISSNVLTPRKKGSKHKYKRSVPPHIPSSKDVHVEREEHNLPILFKKDKQEKNVVEIDLSRFTSVEIRDNKLIAKL